MTSFLSSFKNQSYLQASVTILLFFGSWGIWWSFFQIWLTSEAGGLQLSGAQVGTVYAVNSAVTLVIMLFYGTMQDKLGLRRHLAITAAVLMSLVGPFCVWVYQPLLQNAFWVGTILGAIVLSAGFMAAVALFEALTERLSRTYDFEYGQARMWGSFGYALVALAAGFLFTVNPELNFWLGSVFGVLCLLVLVLWKPRPVPSTSSVADEVGAGGDPEEVSTPGVREMVGLLRIPHLWLIILFVFMTWTFYTVFDQQMFPDFYTGLFDSAARGQQVYGVLNSVQVFAEAAMMGLVPVLMRKLGVRNTLMLGVSVMCLRILGCAIFTDPIAVSAVKMLHAAEVALFILPIFRYFTLHFNPKLSATLYMVGFQISAQIGNVVLSTPLGTLHDRIGYQPTFVVIAIIVALAGLLAFFVLKRDDVDVEGDPFVRDSRKVSA